MAGEASQTLQQIESLLAQLAQEQPEPQVQQAIQGIQKQVEPLQQILGAQQAQGQSSGLENPAGAPGGAAGAIPPPGAGGVPGGAGEPEPELPAAGGAPGGAPPAGGDHHGVAEIHIKMAPGGPKSFGDAKKAAMAQHSASGHFDPHTAKGETPSSEKSKNKAKG